MQQGQIPSYLVNWTRDFTTNRTISFAFDGQSETPKPFTNLIGSQASPTLFAIPADTFLENSTIQNPYLTSPYQYAPNGVETRRYNPHSKNTECMFE
jgi:hypothetical protein